MDSFELNKFLGALLGTCLVLLAVHIASGAIFATPVPAKPGYVIEVKQEAPAAPGAAAKPAEAPIENFLASASVQEGAETAKECELCHNLGKGQGAKIGPDLYGVVGRKVASEAGFNYSSALKDSPAAKSGDGTWTFDKLNTWLTNPRADVPGTLMTFAGIESEKQRANVIADGPGSARSGETRQRAGRRVGAGHEPASRWRRTGEVAAGCFLPAVPSARTRM
jgi:cytochrome c